MFVECSDIPSLLFPRTLYQMKKRSKRLEFGENEYVDVKQVVLNSG